MIIIFKLLLCLHILKFYGVIYLQFAYLVIIMLPCSILLCLWEAIVDSVEKYVGEIPRIKGKDSTHLYYKALSLLIEFFHLGGEGTAKEKLDTKKFNVSSWFTLKIF